MNFDRVADVYDATRSIPEPALEQIAGCIVSAVNATSDTRFLEIGIGTGRIALPIARRGVDYTGIDISEGMMAILRSKAEADGTEVHLVRGDIAHLPFPDASFDVVLAVHVLHLVPEWRRVLDEIWRVVTPGGRFVIGSENESGRDLYSEIRRQWAAFVREEGGELRPRYGTWARLEETLTDLGCYLAVYRAAHWEEPFVPLTLLELQRAKTYSQSWDVPDEVLQRVYDRMLRWVAEKLGDPQAEQMDSEDFLVMVAPKPPAG